MNVPAQIVNNKVKVLFLLFILFSMFLVQGCSKDKNEDSREESFMTISAKEAKEIMDTQSDYIILDVRTEEEYQDGHIKDAVLIPDYEIKDSAKEKLTDPKQLILVYCRSGVRSKNAASELVELGYTNVKEFGGIINWPYDVEK